MIFLILYFLISAAFAIAIGYRDRVDEPELLMFAFFFWPIFIPFALAIFGEWIREQSEGQE